MSNKHYIDPMPALAVRAAERTRTHSHPPVRVYSAAGAVQMGVRPGGSGNDKPAWHRDDIDYDFYLFE